MMFLAEGFTVSGAITSATEIFTSIANLITSNAILIVFVGASLIPIGFKIFRSAKSAAR